MTHPYLTAIRAGAPEWARWLCTNDGHVWWQANRGHGKAWFGEGEMANFDTAWRVGNVVLPRDFGSVAIDLISGDIHLQDAPGLIVVVPMAEWGRE